MSSQLAIRPQVYWDLDDIAAYLQADNPQAALRFLECAEQTFENLAAMPGMGSLYFLRRSRCQELRVFPVRHFKNYLVFYDRTANSVEILRVVHGARNLRAILSQLKQ